MHLTSAFGPAEKHNRVQLVLRNGLHVTISHNGCEVWFTVNEIHLMSVSQI